MSGSQNDNKLESENDVQSPQNTLKHQVRVSKIDARNENDIHTEDLPQQHTMEIRLDPSEKIIKADQSDNTQPEQSEEEQEREEPEEETENQSNPDFGRENSEHREIQHVHVDEIRGDNNPLNVSDPSEDS